MVVFCLYIRRETRQTMLKIKRFLQYRKCVCCGEEYLAYQVERINRNNDYLCSGCKTIKSYYQKNETYQGKETQISFSFEFETSSRNNSLYEY